MAWNKSIFGARVLRALVFVPLFALVSVAHGQNRLSLKIRPGVSFVTTDLVDARPRTGVGLDVIASFRFVTYISMYGGWGFSSFTASKSFAGVDAGFSESGYAFGLQFIHPFDQDMGFDYFVKGGLIINHLEVENSKGGEIADTGYGPGFQVEAGLYFALSYHLHVIPGIKYQTLSRKIALGTTSYRADLNYLSAGVSASWSF